MSNASNLRNQGFSPEFYVYKLINKETGEFYIGSTNNINDRKSNHFSLLKQNSHENKKLQSAYNNNPNFELEVLTVCSNKNEVRTCEKNIIASNWGIKGILNQTIDGSHVITDEIRQKLSIAARQRFIENPELRQIVSERVTKRWQDPSYKDYQSALGKERSANPKFIQQLSNCQTERMSNPANREILREAAIKQMQDSNNRELSRLGAIKQWQYPNFREKRCRKIMIDGNPYESIIEASIALGIDQTTIRKRALADNNWNYVFIH